MYKKSTSAPKREKPVSRERKSSEKPKFTKDKPVFSKDKPKFEKEKSKFNKDKPKFSKDKPKFSKDKPKFEKEKTTDRSFASVRMTEKKPTFGKNKPKFGKTSNQKSTSPLRSATEIKNQKSKITEGIRLNKYIANAGICSRREADTLIESGVVRINGVICTQLGTRVMSDDKVEFGGETLVSEKKVYLLMNKPKDYITTTDDPQERKTVMHLIAGACKERIYPVGRLDRQTTGVLLFTNDGDMAKRLTHPSHGARKIYHVTLDKNITKTDLQTIAKGVELEDGFVHVDEINLIVGTKNEIGIQLHSGMNRVVRRIFEKFDYKVTKLDRVLFAELTKKDLSRGHWRFLTDKEVSFLKMK
jgi:23S rRNA pseudouridine2605 synthase